MYWGQGYAYEAAQYALEYAFEILNCKQAYAFTTLSNRSSRCLMTKLGMRDLNQDLDHPKVSLPSLKRHCLYMIERQDYLLDQFERINTETK